MRLKALGNNNQDLLLGNHHSNIKTQVGERCSPGGSLHLLLPLLSPNQEEAETGGKGSWVGWWRKELSQPPLSPVLQHKYRRQGLLPAGPDPGCLLHSHPRVLAAPWDTAVPCHLLFGCQPTAGCKQCVERRKCWISCSGVGGSLCCSRGGCRLLPGTGTGTSTILLPPGSSETRSTHLAGTISSPVSATRAAKPP